MKQHISPKRLRLQDPHDSWYLRGVNPTAVNEYININIRTKQQDLPRPWYLKKGTSFPPPEQLLLEERGSRFIQNFAYWRKKQQVPPKLCCLMNNSANTSKILLLAEVCNSSTATIVSSPKLHSATFRKTDTRISVDKNNQLDVTFVFFISLLIVAQHVSGNYVPIIMS